MKSDVGGFIYFFIKDKTVFSSFLWGV